MYVSHYFVVIAALKVDKRKIRIQSGQIKIHTELFQFFDGGSGPFERGHSFVDAIVTLNVNAPEKF